MTSKLFQVFCATLVCVLVTVNIGYTQQQILTLSGTALLDATILQDTRSGKEYVANTNYGTYTRNSATAWTHTGSNTYWRSLMYFDLSAIPTRASIQSATLYLYSDPTYSNPNAAEGNSQLSGSNAFYLNIVTGEWDPTSVTWNNQPATTNSGRVYVGASTSSTENLQINLTSTVQGWINNPVSNNGLKMTLENELNYRSRNYASSDHGNIAIRPKLVITFTPLIANVKVSCGTPDITEQQLMSLPWYGNETFLQHFNDSLAQAQSSGGSIARVSGDIESPKLRVSVNFFIYEINASNPGGSYPKILPNEQSIQRMMDNVNNACRNNGINFRYYVKSVNYIDEQSSLLLDGGAGGFREAVAITAHRGDKFAVNVHIVDDISDAGGITYNELNAMFLP